VLEIWRQDAIYTFEFWPEAVVVPPTDLVFALEDARITIGYSRAGDWLFESAHEVAAASERRAWAQDSESMPIVSSGVRSVEGCVGEAWSSTVGLKNLGTVGHVIGIDMGGGVVARVHISYRTPPLSEPTIESVNAVSRRIERTDTSSLVPREGELEYALGPLRVFAPGGWTPFSVVAAKLKGADSRWCASYHLSFEFFLSADAQDGWLESSGYVENMLLIDGVVAAGDHLDRAFDTGSASARAWAALPPPDDDDPDDVDTEAIAVLRWRDGNVCKISSKQEISYAMFDRVRDLARLRDLVLRIAASGRCENRECG